MNHEDPSFNPDPEAFYAEGWPEQERDSWRDDDYEDDVTRQLSDVMRQLDGLLSWIEVAA